MKCSPEYVNTIFDWEKIDPCDRSGSEFVTAGALAVEKVLTDCSPWRGFSLPHSVSTWDTATRPSNSARGHPNPRPASYRSMPFPVDREICCLPWKKIWDTVSMNYVRENVKKTNSRAEKIEKRSAHICLLRVSSRSRYSSSDRWTMAVAS